MRYINVAQSLRKNIFSISENSATRKPNNLNIKHSIIVGSCLEGNFYYVSDLLINMSNK